MGFYASSVLKQGFVSMNAVEEVRQSYLRCRQNSDFFDAFYDHFARKSSEIGAMFSQTDMQQQNLLLSEAISNLILFSEGDSGAAQKIEEIGQSHSQKNLDIKPEWYPLWEEALHDSIRESDPRVNESVLNAWAEVLRPGVDCITSFYRKD